jgi:benzil reductase ((S)-benzoin forming)
MHHLTLLTGASRGMGQAIARQLCRPDALLLCIARHASAELASHAAAQGATLLQWEADLGAPDAVAGRLAAWLQAQDVSQLASATLVNNAGRVGRLGALAPRDGADIALTLRLNLEAPIHLTAAFLEATRDWTVPRKVLNISSGLGRRAMAGGSLYCASKAGLDHFSRCVALDEARNPHPARIVSLAPGVIDTDMQGELRAGNAGAFAEQERFIQLKQNGALTSPDEAAQRILAFLARPDFGDNVVADVREG